MKITVAIPTFYSSKFLKKTLKSLENINFINEVIISDNSVNKKEKYYLEKLVSNFNNLNIKLFFNKSNVGAYKNKYISIQQSSNDFVYQLDSDNRAYLNNLDLDFINNLDESLMYCPSEIYLFKHNYFNKFTKPLKKQKIVYVQDDKLLDIHLIQKEMKEKNLIIDKNIDWVINGGNHIVNKNFYVECLKEGLSTQYNTTSDAITQTYFWLKNGGKVYLSKKLKHFHGLHNNSIWISNPSSAQESIDNFKKLILQL